MSGWRHFGLKMGDGENEVAREVKTILKFSFKRARYEEREMRKGFYCIYRPGYSSPSSQDRDLTTQLKNSSERGYYIEANDTTDVGGGVIRFRRDEPLVRVFDLVDDSIEDPDRRILDGGRSRLPEFQLGAPDYHLIYELLNSERFPVIMKRKSL